MNLLVLLFLASTLVERAGAVFTGTPVFLRWAQIAETATLFGDTPNSEIFHEPIKTAAEIALVVRSLFSSCQLVLFLAAGQF